MLYTFPIYIFFLISQNIVIIPHREKNCFSFLKYVTENQPGLILEIIDHQFLAFSEQFPSITKIMDSLTSFQFCDPLLFPNNFFPFPHACRLVPLSLTYSNLISSIWQPILWAAVWGSFMDMCTATLHCLYLPLVAVAVGDIQQTAFVREQGLGFTAMELLSWMLTAHRVDKRLLFRTANIHK